MAPPFASINDLRRHWPELPEDREEEATQKLAEASLIIRSLYGGIDTKVASGQVDAGLLELIVCRMVKRSLLASINDVEGIASRNETAGGVSMGFSFSNPNGNLYLTKDDKNLLGGGRRNKAFMIVPRFP